jgi:hypothetical protein
VNPGTLTSPELCTAKRDRNRIARLIEKEGACKFCQNRVQGWGTFACIMTGRTFPACLEASVVTFALDESTLAPPGTLQAGEK